MAITPKEWALERENSRLRAELEMLKRTRMGVDYFNAPEDLSTITLANEVETLRLLGGWEIRGSPLGDLHILGRTRHVGGEPGLSLNYYVSREMLWDEQDRASMLGLLHEHVIKEIGRALSSRSW